MKRLVLILLLLSRVNCTAQPNQSLDDIFDIGTVQSLMIEQNDELIYEKFRGGMSRNTTTNIKSASKSVLSLLAGIAIDQGRMDIDETLGDYFPEFFREHPDSVKKSITIRNLLTMRSGLETTSFHNYGRWVMSDNWVRFALSQPLKGTPGRRMAYSTGTSHLLSVILTKATGMTTRQFAEEHLFGSMNIRVGGWDRDTQGYYMGGNNLAISPLALLKIGTLVLNRGEHDGKQLVPASWINESTEIYTRSNYNDYDYGYMWWRRETGGQNLIFAWGNGGQYIFILPELNAVVSITSNVEAGNRSRRYQRRIFTYLERKLIPYLSSGES